jgi:hypothetical protein
MELEYVSYGGIRIIKCGHGENVIVGLHGWAGGYTDFNVFFNWVDVEKQSLYIIEMPGRSGSLPDHTINNSVVSYAELFGEIIEFLNLDGFSIISDCGFSQSIIQYASSHQQKIKSILFLYIPLIVPSVFKLRKGFLVPIYLLSHSNIMLPLLNKMRNSDRIMNKLFVEGNPPESVELARLDISNKRNADLKSIFKNAWSILNTNVIKEWKSINIEMNVLIAEKDELLDTEKGLRYLKMNSKVKLHLLEGHKHHWDDQFLREMQYLYEVL